MPWRGWFRTGVAIGMKVGIGAGGAQAGGARAGGERAGGERGGKYITTYIIRTMRAGRGAHSVKAR
jgi:hypothetical protein